MVLSNKSYEKHSMFLIIKFNTRTTGQRMEVLTEINIRELEKRKLLFSMLCLQISSSKRGNSYIISLLSSSQV